MAERWVMLGKDEERGFAFDTLDGEMTCIFAITRVWFCSGDKRRRYFRTGSFDFCVGEESGVFRLDRIGVLEGVVGPVVGVATSLKVVFL